MSTPLPPGSTIGIVGGGQLGRMLSLAAARLGMRCHIYAPDNGGPAMQVSADKTVATYTDADALQAFAKSCDVVTYEFENVPSDAMALVDATTPVRPGLAALENSQDRLKEKVVVQGLNIQTAPYERVSDADELRAALEKIGTPGILKTRHDGYDGKGQTRIASMPGSPAALLAEMPHTRLIYEGFVNFDCEISVIAARGLTGEVAVFDPGQNTHAGGILRTTVVPASVSQKVITDAALIAGKLLNHLDYVGVIGVEFFVVGQELIVNEYAPRVHNSGHWTQNGCTVDQFEQHIRAICGWPLGPATRHSDVEMENLLGAEVDKWQGVAADGLHLYGKAETREGRKMGHLNRVKKRA